MVRGPRGRPDGVSPRIASRFSHTMDLHTTFPPSLYIAHPSELLRAGFSSIATEAGIVVVGTSGSARETLEAIQAKRPSVAMVDSGFSDPDGFEIARSLADRAAGVRVVMTSYGGDTTHQARARAAKAVNCIAEGCSARDFATAIRSAAAGQAPRPNEPFAMVGARLNATSSQEADRHLTLRERQVLRHVAYGLSNDEIAAALAIGLETVKTHVHKLLRKMSMRDRTQVAVWAVKNGVV